MTQPRTSNSSERSNLPNVKSSKRRRKLPF
jgi:hypothetical protein